MNEVERLQQELADARLDLEHIRLYQDEADRKYAGATFLLDQFSNLRYSLEGDIPTTVIAIRARFHEWVIAAETAVGPKGKPMFTKAQLTAILNTEDALDDVIAGRWKPVAS